MAAKNDGVVRSHLRLARAHEKRGQHTSAAFRLGEIWNVMTPQTDPELQAAADDLRVRLGIRPTAT